MCWSNLFWEEDDGNDCRPLAWRWKRKKEKWELNSITFLWLFIKISFPHISRKQNEVFRWKIVNNGQSFIVYCTHVSRRDTAKFDKHSDHSDKELFLNLSNLLPRMSIDFVYFFLSLSKLIELYRKQISMGSRHHHFWNNPSNLKSNFICHWKKNCPSFSHSFTLLFTPPQHTHNKSIYLRF